MPRGQWISLWGDLPPDLKRKAVECAKAIWLALGNKHVQSLDHWWHSVRLSYIPGPSTRSDPQAIFLNLIEGASDFPSQSARYMVDVLRCRVKICAAEPRHVPVPRECVKAVGEIEDWVRGIPDRKIAEVVRVRAEEEERKRRVREAEARRAREYEHRLLGGVDDEERVLPLGTCQICGGNLASCTKCRLLSCPVERCDGQGPDGLSTCATHPAERFCTSCRAKGSGSGLAAAAATGPVWKRTILATCPFCAKYFCDAELVWCEGAVLLPSTSQAPDGRAQLHQAVALGCRSCIKAQSPDFLSQCSFATCAERDRWKWTIRCCATCASYGMPCPAHPKDWFCTFCKTVAVQSCPTCSQVICPKSTAKHRSCYACGTIDTCNDCRGVKDEDVRVDLSDSDTQSDPASEGDEPKPGDDDMLVNFRSIKCCGGCGTKEYFCHACYEKKTTSTRLKNCSLCGGRYHYPDCGWEGRCPDCGWVSCCEECKGDDCPGCRMPRMDEEALGDAMECMEMMEYENGYCDW